jgi:hypothetical protein
VLASRINTFVGCAAIERTSGVRRARAKLSSSRIRALLLGLSLGALPGPALASEVSWAGPPDCAEREQLVFQVERALAAPLSEVASFQFQVHVERTSPDARARLLVRADAASRVNERLLVAPSCSRLVDTLAVAMALAMEAAAPPRGELERAPKKRTPPQPEPQARPSAHGAEPNVDAPGSAAIGGDTAPSVWRASLWLIGDSGSLPAPGLAAALGLELAWPSFQLRALGTLWLEQHARVAGEPQLGGDVALATGALLACTSPRGGSSQGFTVVLCGGGELGRLSGSGTGVLEPRTGQSLWAAGRVEGDLYWTIPATSLRLGAQLSLAMPFIRDDFVLDEIGRVHRPSSLIGRGGLGMDVAFE